MRKKFSIVLMVAIATVGVIGSWLVPAFNSNIAQAKALAVPLTVTKKNSAQEEPLPIRLIIPSIGLDTSIIPMGINKKGELDVPDGKTSNVGWWSGGPVPGEIGTAVLDAHVYAAFSALKDTRIGSDIYVELSDGTKRHFIVEKSEVFKLQGLSNHTLFESQGYRGLNLITCAGKFSKKMNTYTHRLVVFTKLVS